MEKALVAKSPIGVFAFSEKGKLLHYKIFSKDPVKANAEFSDIADFLSELKDYEVVDGGYEFLRKNIREYAKTLGFAKNNAELNIFISDFCTYKSKSNISGLITKDKLLIQSTNALDDMQKIYNLLDQRLFEWFSLHYPEYRKRDIAEIIVKYGNRENFPGFKSSNGIALGQADEKILKEYAQATHNISITIKSLENYIKITIKEIAPNISSLIDPILAARLLALAGSLEKMARMPSSTLQLLGAEKALFRHLHKRGSSPKYGIIFNSSIVQNASEKNKGKVARIISAKLMKAAKIDFYSKRFEPKLKKELDEELERVK